MALIAVDAGASAIGLVSHKASPRHLESVEIQTIMNELPEDVPAVQVFVDPTAETMSQVQGWNSWTRTAWTPRSSSLPNGP